MRKFVLNEHGGSYEEYLAERTDKCEVCGLTKEKECECTWCSRKYSSKVRTLRKCGLGILFFVIVLSLGIFGYVIFVNNFVWVAIASIVFLVTWYADFKFANTRCKRVPLEPVPAAAFWVVALRVVLFVVALVAIARCVGGEEYFRNDSLPKFGRNQLICVLIIFSVPISIVVAIIKFFYMCVFSSPESFEKFVTVLKVGVPREENRIEDKNDGDEQQRATG